MTTGRVFRWTHLGAFVAGLALVLVTSGCAQQDETAPDAAPDEREATTVDVTLQEWSVAPEETSAPAGEVTFVASNVGKKDHEFMVVRTDLDLTGLPTKKDGSFDDEGEDVQVVDATNAVEDGGGEDHEVIAMGDEKEFTYELDEGSYVLLCNLVEETDDKEEAEVHFKLGMRIPFTVS